MKKIGERKKRKTAIKNISVFQKGKNLNIDNIKEKINSMMIGEAKKKKTQVCAVIFERSINSLMINKKDEVACYAGKGKKMKPLSLKNIEKIVIIGTL